MPRKTNFLYSVTTRRAKGMVQAFSRARRASKERSTAPESISNDAILSHSCACDPVIVVVMQLPPKFPPSPAAYRMGGLARHVRVDLDPDLAGCTVPGDVCACGTAGSGCGTADLTRGI